MRRTAYDYTLFLDADTYVCAHSLQVKKKKAAYDDTLLPDADTYVCARILRVNK